jgi:hypothetical protein
VALGITTTAGVQVPPPTLKNPNGGKGSEAMEPGFVITLSSRDEHQDEPIGLRPPLGVAEGRRESGRPTGSTPDAFEVRSPKATPRPSRNSLPAGHRSWGAHRQPETGAHTHPEPAPTRQAST